MPECVAEVKAPAEVGPRELVERMYGERTGLIRKVIPLWSCYYRVNYHSPADQHKITQSYFVMSKDGLVKEVI